jgi:glycosyltransferase involved in cell wall biosynthesis
VKNLISSQLPSLRKHGGPHYSYPVMAKICLLTPTQPSLNPRIVKEADALAQVGHQVHVLCGHTVAWADDSDATLLRTRKWTCSYVGGKPGSARHCWTRLRHGVVRRFPEIWKLNRTLARCALARITPELQAAALQSDADLYIAHYVGALVGAGVAAKRRSVPLAFDAEDFESGYYEYSSGPRPIDRLTEEVELEYLPRCCYVTAASSGIAEAYASKYCIARPVPILNVFPIAERPPGFRETARSGPLKVYWFSQTIGHDRGLEDVIRAMAMLRNCDIELSLRGRCASGYQEHLAQLASEGGLTLSKVTFSSPAPPEEMIRLSAEHDVGLALEPPTTRNRELCVANKIFSYLLAGNAIAATSTTGQKAVLERLGAAAFLYKTGNYEALASGLRVWHDDRSELQRAREAAWSSGTYSFNWDLEKKKLLDLVKSVLQTEEIGAAIRSSVSA